MVNEDAELCRAIVALRMAAPSEWRRFLEEFAKLADKRKALIDSALWDVQSSNLETFLDNRGNARAMLFLLRSFNAPESRLPPKKPTTETSHRP